MILRIIGTLGGWREIAVRGEHRAALLNLISDTGVRVFASRFAGERCSARLTAPAAKRLFAACEARGIEATLSPLRGLGGLLWRYRRRYGFMLGAAAMIAVTFASRRA